MTKKKNYCPYHFDFDVLHKSFEQWTIKCLTGNEVLMYLKTNKTKKFETVREKERNQFLLFEITSILKRQKVDR